MTLAIRLLAGISVPDSPLISRAIEYARESSEPYLFNHVMRSWLFAVKLAQLRRAAHDEEVLAVATLLHDLGLEKAFSGPLRFEVEGANAARAFARRQGVNGPRAQLIWDGVALNSTPSIGLHKEIEVVLCTAGIGLDWGGWGSEALTRAQMEEIIDTFPRLDMKQRFARAVCRIVETRPDVVLVQPSGPEVPANLLRISIRFAAQVEGPLLPRLSLLRADGRQVQAPFLEQELWSPSGKILTVMMHPGRVKTGLNAQDEGGPILSEGNDVALALDGVPIKRWRVGPADVIGPMASEWKVSAVRVESKQPLVVALDGPIDGRDADYLAIADVRDRRVAGRAQLTNGESIWTFTPSAPWRPGSYKLVVRGTLEDPAGNRLGSHFETSIYSPPGPPVDAVVPFAVGDALSQALRSRM